MNTFVGYTRIHLQTAALLVLGGVAGATVLLGGAASASDALEFGSDPGPLVASCKQWTGANNTSWTNSGNWSPAGTPAATDCITLDNSVFVTNQPTIATGTVVSVTSMTLDQLTLTINGTGSLSLTSASPSAMTSGTVAGSGTLNVNGAMSWTSGAMTGSGSTVVTSGGTLTIAPTATSNYAILDTRTLTNNSGGTVSYTPVSGGYSWYFGANTCLPTTFVNNGTFTYSGPNSSDPGIVGCGTAALITNGATGTFTKNAGTATAPVGPALNNAGAVAATAGTLQLTGGSNSGTGTFTGTSPGTISLQAGTFKLGNGAALSGVSVDGGATVQAGVTGTTSTVNVTLTGTNTLTGGSLDGNGTFTINGTLNWVAGSMASTGTGTGTTVVTSGGTLAIAPTATSNYAILDTRTLTNNSGGTVNYTPVSSGYQWYFGANTCLPTTFVNNGTFTYSGPNSSDPGIVNCGTALISNGATGTFTKNAGTATAPVAPAFRNNGSVSATVGTLQLTGDPTSAVGTFSAVTPAKVSLAGGTFVLGSGSTFTGGVFVDGATVQAGVTGTTSTVNVTLTGTNTLTGGSLDGNGTFTINGTLNWVAGSMASTGTGTGTGTTVVTSGGTLAIAPTATSNYAILDTRTLTNNSGGTVNYTPVSSGYQWYFGANTCLPTTFVNNGTFTYSGPNSSDPGIVNCGTALISNGATGAFTKNAGTATSQIGPDFDNVGTIAVSAGTLQLQGAFPAYNGTNTLTKGTYNITSPGILQFNNAGITTNQANVTLNGGTGALIQNTSGINALPNLATNSGSLTVRNRSQTVKPFTNSGTVAVGPGASASTLVISGTGAYTQSAGSTVVSDATSTLNTGGAGTVSINGGTLSGTGTVLGTVVGAGTVAPGSPSGTLTATTYTPAAGATLSTRITSGAGSTLAVTGTGTLSGTLAITTTGTAPTVGSVYNVVTAGTRTGTFSAVTGQDIAGTNTYYDLSYTNTSAVLTVKNKPQISVADVTVTEGDSGTTTATFAVTMDNPTGRTVTVDYATSNGTAQATSDYVAGSGTLTFAAGITSRSISVSVTGDTLYEADETFSVSLSNPVNALVGTGTATGTITNDDPAPSVSIADVSQTEGNSGTSTMTFPVTLSTASGRSSSVSYATSDGTATSGTDYAATSGTLTIPAGSTTGSVNVTINGDTAVEADETFTVTLSSPVGVTISRSAATGTIQNEDVAGGTTVTGVTPSTIGQGAPSRLVTITGSGFASGATVTVSGSGVTASSVTAVSATSITAKLKATATAATGLRNVTVTVGTSSGTCMGCLTVNAKPVVASLNPSSLGQGAVKTVSLTGSGFASGMTVKVTQSGAPTTSVKATLVTVQSLTGATAKFTVASSAPPGNYNVLVTNKDGGKSTTANAFTVVAGPTVTAINPSSVARGTNNLSVTITGTNFVSGVTVKGPTGVTFASVAFVNSTTITATITVASTATPGTNLPVTVTNPASAGFGSGTGNVLTIS